METNMAPLTREHAERMFRDTMGLRFNLDLKPDFESNCCGRDIKRLVEWYNRMYRPKNEINDWPEVRANLVRFQKHLSHPSNHRQFFRAMRELFEAGIEAEAAGIISPYDPSKGLTFDERTPYRRAKAYCQNLCEAVRAYPWLFYKIMVLHLSTPQPYYEEDRAL